MEKYSIRSLVGRLCEPEIPEFPLETELNLPNQRVINLDALRTRSDLLKPNEKNILEKLLTYYCKTEKVTYKQGMNEILAPFLLLNRHNVPLHICYTCFKNFVAKFIPTLFVDDAFKPLSGLYVITKLILKYHLPDLSTCFSNNEITPDIYMTTWYVTMFSSKIKELGLLYIFWQYLIDTNDNLFIIYFGIALFEFFKQEIQNQEVMSLPNVFKKICIVDYDTLQIVLQNSERIKANMPFTADMILKKYNMFCLENTESFVKLLEKFMCLLILPREIIIQTYPHDAVCKCLDPRNCKTKRLKYLLIDCRPTKEQKNGYFINSQLLSKAAQKYPNKLLNYPKSFISLKKNTHIALMGSEENKDEENLVQKLFDSFIQHEFPYVSIVFGGYKSCHEFALLHNFEILSHKIKRCLACNSCDDSENKAKELTLDSFFRIGSTQKTLTPVIKDSLIKTEKIYKCKINESQDIEESDIGLIVTLKQIYLWDIRRNEVIEVFDIDQLTKITSNKTCSENLYFSFIKIPKRSFILRPEECKEFLFKVRTNFQAMRN
ncbi:hypothetical protein SteCoe_20559 [Stentor coeruleus]|uniref:Rab-GAP TBC domain-containing protein n=1 Tax=Stentor coeruleus TaxID=5963 RepID=A0A1R2BS51_9CILI|nr:hypothetical protein SteCoe_20559 [Stentor coeruleus]